MATKKSTGVVDIELIDSFSDQFDEDPRLAEERDDGLFFAGTLAATCLQGRTRSELVEIARCVEAEAIAGAREVLSEIAFYRQEVVDRKASGHYDEEMHVKEIVSAWGHLDLLEYRWATTDFLVTRTFACGRRLRSLRCGAATLHD